jgi:hypothetical protein
MTDPLTEFLLARIAEDRGIALAATQGPWEARPYWFESSGHSYATIPGVIYEEIDAEDGVHIARWDPARVLAECEAKRRMIEDLVAESAEHWGPRESPEREWEWCPKVRTREFCAHTDLEWGPDAPCECGAEWPAYKQVPLLRYFTLPYADHPDFREEWLP